MATTTTLRRCALGSSLLVLFAASSCVFDASVDFTTGAGGSVSSGAGATGGAGGAGGGCIPSNCGTDDTCQTFSCDENNMCAVAYTDAGTACMLGQVNGVCDGMGTCVEPGGPCDDPSDCPTDYCVDGFCCNSECDSQCQTCNGMVPGLCVPTAAGQTDTDTSCDSPSVCDGAENCVNGRPTFAAAYSGPNSQVVRSVRYDSSGNLFVVGNFRDTTNFGDGNVSTPGREIFVLKYDSNNTLLWKSFIGITGTNFSGWADHMALNAQGNVVIAGQFRGTIDLAGSSVSATGNNYDLFLAELSSADGAVVTSRALTNQGQQLVSGLDIDSAGTIHLLANFFQDDWSLDSGTLTNNGANDIAILKLNSDFTVTSADSYGGAANQTSRDIVIDGQGNTIVTGYYFGDIPLQPAADSLSSTGDDAFIIKFDPSNNVVFSHSYGAAGNEDRTEKVRLDSQGNIWLLGNGDGDIDLGNGTTITNQDFHDTWLIKFDPSGTVLDHLHFGGPSYDAAQSFTIDKDDNIVMVLFAGYTGPLDLGGGVLPAPGLADAVIAKFAADGTHLWSAAYGDGENQFFYDVAVDDQGAIAAPGWFQGELNIVSPALVGNELASANASDNVYDGFVATFAP